VPDRTKAYLGNFPNVLYLVEKIEVL